jgi:4-hydroxyphenylacetate 3-monooxygenase
VKDVTSHASFNPLIDIGARIYDIAHDPATRGLMTVEEAGERFAVALRVLPWTGAPSGCS